MLIQALGHACVLYQFEIGLDLCKGKGASGSTLPCDVCTVHAFGVFSHF